MAMQKKIGTKRLTNERMLHILMDEMTDIRNELKQEISDVRTELKTDIFVLSHKIDSVASDLGNLRLEVHQNHLTFMKNHDNLAKRTMVLEAK